MVGHGPGPADRGAAGGIASDPAIADAAVAFAIGHRDILGFIDLPIEDRAIVLEVLHQADEMESQRRAAEREDLANRLAPKLARLFH
jgi:hypothetical protein